MKQGGIGNSTEYRLYYSVTWNIQGVMRNRTRCGTEEGGRDSKSGERGEHALAIFLPLLC